MMPLFSWPMWPPSERYTPPIREKQTQGQIKSRLISPSPKHRGGTAVAHTPEDNLEVNMVSGRVWLWVFWCWRLLACSQPHSVAQTLQPESAKLISAKEDFFTAAVLTAGPLYCTSREGLRTWEPMWPHPPLLDPLPPSHRDTHHVL